MSVRSLITVRLPRAFALGRLSMAQALGRATSGRVRADFRAFELHPREYRFAKQILLSRTQIWLWRTNQKELAGDFALVDMSSPDPRRRPVWVVDLKLGAEVRFGGGGAGNQLTKAAAAVDALAAAGVVRPRKPTLATGDGGALFTALQAAHGRRRSSLNSR